MNVFQFNQFAIVSCLPHIKLRQFLLIHLNENSRALMALTEPYAHGREALQVVLRPINPSAPSSL